MGDAAVWVAAGAGILGAAVGGGFALAASAKQAAATRDEGASDRKHLHDMAKEDRQHQREMALEERQQERILSAYLAIQRHVSLWALWAQWASRISLSGQPEPAPEAPATDSVTTAIIELQSSHQIIEAMRVFSSHVIHFQLAVNDVSHAFGDVPMDEVPAAIAKAGWAGPRELQALREAASGVVSAADEVSRKMRTERLSHLAWIFG